jgi:hypothetical protein
MDQASEDVNVNMSSFQLRTAALGALLLACGACQGKPAQEKSSPLLVTQILPASAVLDLGTEDGRAILTEGFSPPEQVGPRRASWSEGSASELSFSVQGDAKEHLLAFVAEPYFPISPVSVKVAINDKPVGELQLASGWKAYKLKIPDGLIKNGDNALNFDYSKTARPSATEPGSTDERELSVRFAQIQVQPILEGMSVLFDSHNALAFALMGEGWAEDPGDPAPGIWTVGHQASMAIHLTKVSGTNYKIALTARAMGGAGHQTATLKLNQRPIGELNFSERKGTQQLQLPADLLREDNELVLELAAVKSPAQIDPRSTDQRLLGLRISKLEIQPVPAVTSSN